MDDSNTFLGVEMRVEGSLIGENHNPVATVRNLCSKIDFFCFKYNLFNTDLTQWGDRGQEAE